MQTSTKHNDFEMFLNYPQFSWTSLETILKTMFFFTHETSCYHLVLLVTTHNLMQEFQNNIKSIIWEKGQLGVGN